MKFKFDEHSDVIKQISRFQSKIVGIWLLRALISGVLTGIIGLFALVLVSQHFHTLPNYIHALSILPAIAVFMRKYSALRRDFAHIPANIDHQLCNNSIVLTCFDLHQTSNTNAEFSNSILKRAKQTLEKSGFFEFKALKSPIELILLIFISLVTFVLMISHKTSPIIIEYEGFDKNIIAEVAELEAIANIKQDKKLLKLLAETKNKLLNNEFNSLTSIFLEIEDKIKARKENSEKIYDFIEKSKESEQTDTELLKKALELAQKNIELRKSADIVEKEKQRLIHLDLDEILKILRKNLQDDELLMEKLNAFVEKNIQIKNLEKPDDADVNDDPLNKTDFEDEKWVFSKPEPAKIQIISKNDTSSIIDFYAITEQFTDFEHNQLRKRIVAELNRNK